jgi:hypothetical protein
MTLNRWILPAACVPTTCALPAHAIPQSCRFTVECHGAGACDEAGFTRALRDGFEAGQVRLGGPVDRRLVGDMDLAESGGASIVAHMASTLQILTIGADGTARHALHLTDGPEAIPHHGMCEAP